MMHHAILILITFSVTPLAENSLNISFEISKSEVSERAPGGYAGAIGGAGGGGAAGPTCLEGMTVEGPDTIKMYVPGCENFTFLGYHQDNVIYYMEFFLNEYYKMLV